jgi:hypothetical protein
MCSLRRPVPVPSPQVPNGLMGITQPMATADEAAADEAQLTNPEAADEAQLTNPEAADEAQLTNPESTSPDAPAAKATEAAPGGAAPAAAPAAARAPPKRGRLKSKDDVAEAAREQGKGKGPAEPKKKKRSPIKGNFGATFKFTPRGSPVDTGEKKRFVDCR